MKKILILAVAIAATTVFAGCSKKEDTVIIEGPIVGKWEYVEAFFYTWGRYGGDWTARLEYLPGERTIEFTKNGTVLHRHEGAKETWGYSYDATTHQVVYNHAPAQKYTVDITGSQLIVRDPYLQVEYEAKFILKRVY